MPVTIPITSLTGKQFARARSLRLPVGYDGATFVVPSSRAGEPAHHVHFDDQDEPSLYTCTCPAGQRGNPCWAAARAYDAATALSVNQIYFTRRGPASLVTAAHAGPRPPLRASVGEGGELMLMVSATPLAGHVLTIP